jgi:capsular exopolysaccharide synthesis family protein
MMRQEHVVAGGHAASLVENRLDCSRLVVWEPRRHERRARVGSGALSVDLRYYLRLLRRWWLALLLVMLVFALPAYQYTRSQPHIYRATATVFVNQTAAPGSVTYSDALLNQQLVKTYSRMAEQPVVLAEVAGRLQLSLSAGRLAGMVSVSPVRDTQLFEVAVTGRDPALIRDIANTTAQVFIDQQNAFLPAGQQASGLRMAQPALEPVVPIGPHPVRNAVLAALLGLFVAAGVISLLEYLDDTVKTPEDLEKIASLATLGAVARIPKADARRYGQLVTNGKTSAVSESFRLIRTNLDFAKADHDLRVVLVTSANPSEGKSTTAANLAVVLAQAGKRVILIDADLRKPSVHRIFGVTNRGGLSNLLIRDESNLASVTHATSIPYLRVLTAGPLPPNPAELLASPRLATLLDRLSCLVDTIIIDSPPVLAVSDAIVLAGAVDGTLLVIDSTRTRADSLRRAVDALGKSGTRLLGGVLSKVSTRSGDYYHYHSSEYYQEQPSAPAPATQRVPVADGSGRGRLERVRTSLPVLLPIRRPGQ